MLTGSVYTDANLSNGMCSDIAELIEQYSDMVYRLCYINMKHKYDAEDAYQDVFLKLHLKLNDETDSEPFESDEHLKAWLIRVTINQCKSIKNTAHRRRDILMDETFMCGTNDTLSEKAADYVMKLPKRYRQIVFLFYYEQYTSEEIAGIIGSSNNSVRTNLSRARKMIKKNLERRSKGEKS